MIETVIIEKAINEIQIQEFGTTKQILEIHEVIYENGKPKVIRVDRENNDGTAVVYFQITGEKFHLAVWLDTYPKVLVRSVDTENYNSVYLRIVSDHLNFQELASMTKLQPTSGWNKGDVRKSGKSFYNFSALNFEPNPEPDEFNDKLKKLLDYIDEDKEGMTNLFGKSYALIQIATIFHNGNTMLGGHHLDKATIKRISSYNLEIDFDLYAEGKFFKD